jgi:hypothetical protein
MRRRIAAGATVGLLFITLIGGCAPRSGAAGDLVERWLAAAEGGAEDRGWSMLDEMIHFTSFDGDADAYAEAMAAADWDAVTWRTESARSVGNEQTSVTVVADGPIPEVFAERSIAFPRCSGGTPTGLRFMVGDFSELGPQIGLGFWDGMTEIWTCGEEGEPEFQASENETIWAGYGLEITNNTELPVTLVSANGRDTDVPPCQTMSFTAMAGPLTLSNEQGTIGEVEGSGEENVATRYVLVGQRSVYDELHPPVYPLPPCGGVPSTR